MSASVANLMAAIATNARFGAASGANCAPVLIKRMHDAITMPLHAPRISAARPRRTPQEDIHREQVGPRGETRDGIGLIEFGSSDRVALDEIASEGSRSRSGADMEA